MEKPLVVTAKSTEFGQICLQDAQTPKHQIGNGMVQEALRFAKDGKHFLIFMMIWEIA